MIFQWILLQATTPPANQPSPSGGGMFISLMPFILIFVIMYFFLFRPQARKAKEHQKLLSSISTGTEVVTSGGLHGIVKGTKGANGEIIIVQIADGVKVEMDRAAVARVKGLEGK